MTFSKSFRVAFVATLSAVLVVVVACTARLVAWPIWQEYRGCQVMLISLRSLRAKDSLKFDEAIETLKRTRGGSVAATVLVSELAANSDADVRRLAIRGLEALGPQVQQVIPALINALKDPDGKVRKDSAALLAKLGPQARPAVPYLVARLVDSDAEAREAAGDALARIRPDERDMPATITRLLELLQHRSPGVRGIAARLLALLVNAENDCAVLSLAAALSDKETEVRRYSAFALGEIGPAAAPAIPDLIRNLEDPDRIACFNAAQAVLKIDRSVSEAVVPALIEMLEDPGPDVRAMAARHLGLVGPRAHAAVPALITAIQDKHTGVSADAARALEEIDPQTAMAVRKALEEETQ